MPDAEHDEEDDLQRHDDPTELWPDAWAAGAPWHSFASHADPIGTALYSPCFFAKCHIIVQCRIEVINHQSCIHSLIESLALQHFCVNCAVDIATDARST